MKSILKVHNLSIQYPYTAKPTLENISITVEKGEALLIIGASGCGKSSLALAIAGLIPRTIEAEQQGSIYLEGRDIAEMSPGEVCQQVGFVFQDPEAQFCMLTVEDEIAFGLENAGFSPDLIEERIEEALEKVGMTEHRYSHTHRLSGGMKQRVALACALALHPPILILDEPTANLDPAATEDFFRLLESLIATRSHTILLVEHKLEKPAALMDRVVVINEGKIVAENSPRHVFAQQNQLLMKIGVWQPYASELAGKLEKTGISFSPFPLTVAELLEHAEKDSQTSNALAKQVARHIEVTDSLEPAAEEMAIDCRQVSFCYKTPFQEAKVLENLQWQVRPGSFLALLGENGVGKSTLARLVLGLLKPSKGSISLFGKNTKSISRKKVAEIAGLVFQNPEHQFLTDSTWEEIAYSLKLANIPGTEIPRRVQELLKEFSLEEKAEANPFTLSQGEKRRLSVASMLATDQQLLILDEPSFGQDYQNTYKLMNLVKARQLKGCTVVMITHDMRLVWEFATEVALMSEGKLAYTGDPQDLFYQNTLLEACSLKAPLPLHIMEGLKSAGKRESMKKPSTLKIDALKVGSLNV
ncbi:ABC transporter ATP-binding protein [Tindallia californiensis]|uniref:Energy-coupling factor transport system ATP-binding protein n=1 Tax=Tindallia californiensis TaxID=159292 RepID=A0A1H3QH70_9FIRM|nr:ABC transporter ATP-binding protein [Tindallia californiensis]SDZ12049.1 energy-coupling factor transport system ATP-binding protein [Tindallia californiensis]